MAIQEQAHATDTVRHAADELNEAVRGLLGSLEQLESVLDPVLQPLPADKSVPPGPNTPRMQPCSDWPPGIYFGRGFAG